MDGIKADVQIDCCGLYCPMPVINAQSGLEKMTGGQVIEITATDDGVADDFPMFCKSRKLKLLKLEKRDGVYTILIQKPCEAR
ncbi:MAG TPA: sulfurtransferase TusA family protein [Candidatus Wallbacteria bacterium]|nr:MAG: sulfur transfer protein SirA [bacterium ADurb.Bin243]HOD40730.1 sulfurtransferase TusA family protein [Candidatus Wallbacteria bacterium]HPG57243.1 sulfurtransferase TusA family protein [Candidatus Wallbacteria bacterium]